MAETKQFEIRQRYASITRRYDVYSQDLDGVQGPLVARAEQRRFTKRATFYADEARTQPIFGFRDINPDGTCEVSEAAEGLPIGQFRKNYAKSLLRSTWHLSTKDGLTAVGQERSGAVAVARRVLELLNSAFEPRYHFDFVTSDGYAVLSCERDRSVSDRYQVTIPVAPDGRQLDWRLGVAMSVALDAFQGR